MTLKTITLMNLLLALWLSCPFIVNAQSQLLNQVKLTPGALFTTSVNDPYHLFAVDSETVIFMRDYHCAKLSTTVIGVKKSSYFASFVYVKEVKVTRREAFDPAVGAAVARRLIGKRLPYDTRRCNKRKYRLYFLQGDATNHIKGQKWLLGDMSPNCPLRRSLHGLTVADVESLNFELESDNYIYPFDSFEPYPDYNQYYGPESILQSKYKIVRKSGSSGSGSGSSIGKSGSSLNKSSSFGWLNFLKRIGSSVGKSSSSVGKSGGSVGKTGSFVTSRASSMDYFTENGD